MYLNIDSSIKPVVEPARRIPIPDQLEMHHIITEFVETTDWVSNLVLVKRNNKIRICIDPIMLNCALKRRHYQIPTIKKLLPELTKANIFTTCDVKSGFWQVTLDEESSRLTTFWMPCGRYRWLRMPFGISAAPQIFQRKIRRL